LLTRTCRPASTSMSRSDLSLVLYLGRRSDLRHGGRKRWISGLIPLMYAFE